MPMHDWTRVEAGTYHDFHCAWITHLKEALNGGLLPEGYYALAEQHAGRLMADVLTLQASEPAGDSPGQEGGVAVVPPRVGRKLTASPIASYRALRRSLAIRHTSGHRIVALIEIVSPANKDRPSSVEDFVKKVESALRMGVHVLVVDPLPPGRHDPRGIHAAVWERFDPEDDFLPPNRPLTLASYVAGAMAEAYVEHLAIGEPLPEMPLFLQVHSYINIPLEPTYQAAYRGMPSFWREVLEGRRDVVPG